MSKLCPLSFSADHGCADCVEDRCAWWDEDCCAMLAIPVELRDGHDVLNGLAVDLDHAKDELKESLDNIYTKI